MLGFFLFYFFFFFFFPDARKPPHIGRCSTLVVSLYYIGTDRPFIFLASLIISNKPASNISFFLLSLLLFVLHCISMPWSLVRLRRTGLKNKSKEGITTVRSPTLKGKVKNTGDDCALTLDGVIRPALLSPRTVPNCRRYGGVAFSL